MSALCVPAPRVVGRDLELRQLRGAVENGHNHRGGTTFIIGEAGIGKSRLTLEAAERAHQLGMHVLRGRASAMGPAAPFRPITEALFSLTRSGNLPADWELAPYRSSLGRLLPEWRDAGSSCADSSLLVAAEGLLRLLAVLGKENGTLLVLEDLHEADAETLSIVDYLADNLERLPVVLLVTARRETSPILELAKGSGRRSAVTVLEPQRLTTPQVHDLVCTCLGGVPGAVPTATARRIVQHSDGVPFVIEELLESWVAAGELVPVENGWLVRDVADLTVPETVVFNVANRVRRLGDPVGSVLRAAAVLGRRFPLSVVESMCDLDRPTALRLVGTAIAAQLVTPDLLAPDWYVFRHALTAEALLAQVVPAERAVLARRAAVAVAARHPDLPGEWCTVAARLHADAGDALTAGRLYTEAGRRTLADGAAASAAQLLERAHELLGTAGADADQRAEVLEALLHALADAGQVERAMSLASTMDARVLGPERQASLHIMLAVVAQRAGLWPQSGAEVATARELLGTTGPARLLAQLEVISAGLTMETPGADRRVLAEQLAGKALVTAEALDLSEVACEALELLGILSRQTDIAQSDRYFDRMSTVALAHGNRALQLRAMARSGINEALRTGSQRLLQQAHDETFRVGAITEAYLLEVNLVMGAVLRGEYPAAAQLLHECLPVVTRLGLRYAIRYALMAKAAMFAHQARRGEMLETLEEFREWHGDESHQQPLVYGLCEAICALLEENRAAAGAALDRSIACEADNPTNYVLTGRSGLRVLLGVLDRRMDRDDLASVAETPPAKLAWNRQFLDLAHAVLLGREGLPEQATALVEASTGPANPFTMARHLGLRLVAEAAVADRWGDPGTWLRGAESYFHAHAVTAVDEACRRLLRRAGMTVSPRRAGSENLPQDIRVKGITVREYEVLRLLAGRLSNTEIGRRLYISPRTVEKHVASLIGKTGKPDRAALIDLAARVCGTSRTNQEPP